MGNIFLRRLNSKRMQVFRFRRTKVEAYEYGNGKSDTGIFQRIENRARRGNFNLKTKRYANINNLFVLGMLKCSWLMEHFNLHS